MMEQVLDDMEYMLNLRPHACLGVLDLPDQGANRVAGMQLLVCRTTPGDHQPGVDDAAVPPAEIADLRLPAPVPAGELLSNASVNTGGSAS